MPNLFGSPNCAEIKVKSGRSLLPPACTKCLDVSTTSGYSPSIWLRNKDSTFCISASSFTSRALSILGTPSGDIYFIKLAKEVAVFNNKEGAKPSTTELTIAVEIAIRLLTVGTMIETESFCGSEKNIMMITRI